MNHCSLIQHGWSPAECSGFDSYFIALAKVKNASLFTDDNGMQHHGREAAVDVILIREMDDDGIEKLFVQSF